MCLKVKVWSTLQNIHWFKLNQFQIDLIKLLDSLSVDIFVSVLSILKAV